MIMSAKAGVVILAANFVCFAASAVVVDANALGFLPDAEPAANAAALQKALDGGMRKVVVSRLKGKVEYPASFMLIAATNPCPCGYYGDGDRCTCTVGQRVGYLSRLSGPLLDRIDLHVWMHPVDTKRLISRPKGDRSAAVAARVAAAREVQKQRFRADGISTNAEMNNALMERYCPLSDDCKSLLENIIDRLGLSARAYSRIVRISRTIADLAGVSDILPAHISEAAGYRFLDRRNFGEL